MSVQFIQDAILKGVELRTDLLKWKLIAVGGIGSFGVGGGSNTHAPWVLVLVPLICAYVDLIYRNSCLRRNALRAFAMSKHADPTYAPLAEVLRYEQGEFAQRTKRFSFESGALVWSSLLLSVAVALYPLITGLSDALRTALVTAGITGCVLSIAVELLYARFDTLKIG
ncbi:hypothetical protein [Uliginosibacterium sp. H1]|uniref:hypothetical protein n=1 Tax=Uliginosibacterium sp. H1 TaxID=3114757 RepID=UPI002E19860E|nr:hypothetical protein [Uliginosibacterium sp. H1]